MCGRGALIVLEGLDRSGKTTQAKKLADWLISEGKKVHLIRFPDREEPIGKVIDSYLKREIDISPQALHLSFSANRWQKEKEIRSLVSSGVYVICDRYCYSGVAYSVASGLNCDWARQPDIGLPQPDIVLFFMIDSSVAASRGGYGDERLEEEDLQKKVSIEMMKLKNEEWKIVDANQDMDKVTNQVKSFIHNMVLNDKLGSITHL